MDATTRLGIVRTIATGLLGGFTLGVAARAWMRLITTDPEFTWNGTMFIVLGFTIWGTGQAAASAIRSRTVGRWKVATARGIGAVTTLPLFMAAGGIMAPTVIAGSLALHRADWSKWVRVVLAVVATLPVVSVGIRLEDDFGLGWRYLAGMFALLAIYALVVVAERATTQRSAYGGRIYGVLRIVSIVGVFVVIVVASRGID